MAAGLVRRQPDTRRGAMMERGMKKTGADTYCDEVLNRWVSDATRGFPDDIQARIREEVTAHYYDAFEEHRSRGSTTLQAHDAAMAALGDAWKARLRCQVVHPDRLHPECLAATYGPTRHLWKFPLEAAVLAIMLSPTLSGFPPATWLAAVISITTFGLVSIAILKWLAAKGKWATVIILDTVFVLSWGGICLFTCWVMSNNMLMEGFWWGWIVLLMLCAAGYVLFILWMLRKLGPMLDTRQ